MTCFGQCGMSESDIYYSGAEAITWLCHLYFLFAIKTSQTHVGTAPLPLVPERREHAAKPQETSGGHACEKIKTSIVFSYLSHWSQSLLQHNVAQADRYTPQCRFQQLPPYVTIVSHEQSSYIISL